MSENEIKRVISDQAKAAYLNKTVDFGTEKFKVRGLKVRATSRAIPKSDYDGTSADFTIAFAEKINEIVTAGKN